MNRPPEDNDNGNDKDIDNEIDPYDYEGIFVEAARPDPPRTARIKDSKAIRKVVALVVVLVVVLIVGTTINGKFTPGGKQGKEVTVQIPAGSSVGDIASLLDEKKVIPSALAMRIWVKTHGGGTNLKAGEYSFYANSSAAEALAVLKDGPKVKTDKLVVPEGRRVIQVAELVGKLAGLSAQKFLDLARSGTVRSDFQPTNTKSLEGYLFPDTYFVSPSDTEETLLRRMVSQFDTEARRTGLGDSERRISQTPSDTLIIASLIEAEAKIPDDRGKISQVITQRLFKGMKLQIDATVLYALGNDRAVLSNNDLKVDSPYNTYQNLGLPPTPICNPGVAAIQAALNPTPGPWLYYVVINEDGGHAFAATYQEHLQNIKQAEKNGVR